MTDYGAPEWLRTLRGFPAYRICTVLHWLYFALLPYEGDWIYRKERREARRAQPDPAGSSEGER